MWKGATDHLSIEIESEIQYEMLTLGVDVHMDGEVMGRRMRRQDAKDVGVELRIDTCLQDPRFRFTSRQIFHLTLPPFKSLRDVTIFRSAITK